MGKDRAEIILGGLFLVLGIITFIATIQGFINRSEGYSIVLVSGILSFFLLYVAIMILTQKNEKDETK